METGATHRLRHQPAGCADLDRWSASAGWAMQIGCRQAEPRYDSPSGGHVLQAPRLLTGHPASCPLCDPIIPIALISFQLSRPTSVSQKGRSWPETAAVGQQNATASLRNFGLRCPRCPASRSRLLHKLLFSQEALLPAPAHAAYCCSSLRPSPDHAGLSRALCFFCRSRRLGGSPRRQPARGGQVLDRPRGGAQVGERERVRGRVSRRVAGAVGRAR